MVVVEGKFSVSFGPKLQLRLRIWTWTKLNNKTNLCIKYIVKLVNKSPTHMVTGKFLTN